MLIAHYCTIQS